MRPQRPCRWIAVQGGELPQRPQTLNSSKSKNRGTGGPHPQVFPIVCSPFHSYSTTFVRGPNGLLAVGRLALQWGGNDPLTKRPARQLHPSSAYHQRSTHNSRAPISQRFQ